MSRATAPAAALLLLASACAKDAASLSPFPCAQDNTCAGGLACLPGTGCVKATADSFCPAGNDCGDTSEGTKAGAATL